MTRTRPTAFRSNPRRRGRRAREAVLAALACAGAALCAAAPAAAEERGVAPDDPLAAARTLVRLVREDGSPRTDLRDAVRALEAYARAASAGPDGRPADASAEAVREAGLLLAEADDAAERLLRYEAERLLPNGHLPQFVPPARRVLEDELARLAERLFPDEAPLRRFRPEGLVAVPPERSAPAPELTGRPVLGGLYLLRGDGLACAAWAPRDADPPRFGALAAATSEEDLLLEPPPAAGWTAAVTMNGRAPAVASLPEGRPLPHAWRRGTVLDALSVSWDLQPPETAPTGLVRRVVLVKEAPAWLLVTDRVSVPAPAVTIGQHLLLAPGFAGAASLHLPEGAEPAQDADGILHLQTERPGRGAAEFLVIPRSGESAPPVRHLHARADGGGAWEIRHDGAAREDLLLTTCGGEPLEGTLERWTVRLSGDLALWRFGETGLRRAAFLGTHEAQARRDRGAAWRFAFSARADAEIRLLPGGAVSATLLDSGTGPVRLECTRRAFGASEAARAEVTLLGGRTVVFRPF
jgi:hypothetical protein